MSVFKSSSDSILDFVEKRIRVMDKEEYLELEAALLEILEAQNNTVNNRFSDKDEEDDV